MSNPNEQPLIGIGNKPRVKLVNNVRDTGKILQNNMIIIEGRIVEAILLEHYDFNLKEIVGKLRDKDNQTIEKQQELLDIMKQFQNDCEVKLIPTTIRKSVLVHKRIVYKGDVLVDIILNDDTSIKVTSPEGKYTNSINKVFQQLSKENGSTEEK